MSGNTRPAPAPAPPPTLREKFLTEWASMLGAIVDKITGELVDDGYIDLGPG